MTSNEPHSGHHKRRLIFYYPSLDEKALSASSYAALLVNPYKEKPPLNQGRFCGADGTRTRDPRRDRPVF